jgi:hypothetical protein
MGLLSASIRAYTCGITAAGGKQVSIKKSLKIVPFLALLTIVPLDAGLITASGAGPLPASAQDLTGLFPTEIVGTLPDTTDVSMFKIDIFNFQLFSAMTIGGPFGIPDTELFLFDSTGHGVYANDDMGGPDSIAMTLSCLPSAINNPCAEPFQPGVGPTSNGVYYLAITRSANLPLDASFNDIFLPFINIGDVVGPDLGGGGVNPVAGWDGGAFSSPDFDQINYDIVLTGTTAPEPATWSMMGIAALGVLLLRRKAR